MSTLIMSMRQRHDSRKRKHGDNYHYSDPKTKCDNVKETTSQLILNFPHSYNGRTYATIPENGSNPNFVKGSSTFNDNTDTFYCFVTIRGIECSSYIKQLVVTDFSKSILVPSNTNYTIEVAFYERCGVWDESSNYQNARPFYQFKKSYNDYHSHHFIELKYYSTKKC